MKRNRTQHIALMLAALAVSLVLMCACGGRKEMSNLVIVQNEVFTLTGDSIIEDSVCKDCFPFFHFGISDVGPTVKVERRIGVMGMGW